MKEGECIIKGLERLDQFWISLKKGLSWLWRTCIFEKEMKSREEKKVHDK